MHHVGGSYGLFNGFVIVVSFELIFWLVIIVAQSCRGGESTLYKDTSSVGYSYFSSTSLHGFVYFKVWPP